MPEAKGRREANPVRPRPRPRNDHSPEEFGKDILDDESTVTAEADTNPDRPRRFAVTRPRGPASLDRPDGDCRAARWG